jgi:hypothetical protein
MPHLAKLVLVSAMLAASPLAQGSQDTTGTAPAVRALSEDELEGLRAGFGPIGVPVLALSLPSQLRHADLARWCRLLEVEPALAARLKLALEFAQGEDDALRAKELPPLFARAAMVVSRPAQALSVDEVNRLCRAISDSRRRVLSAMFARERDSLLRGLAARPAGQVGPIEALGEVSDAERSVLESLAQLRSIELVESIGYAVATPEVARWGVGRLLEADGEQLLTAESRSVARMIYRDALPELDAISRTHQLALGRAIGAGARVSLGSELRQAYGSPSPDVLSDWDAEWRRALAATAREGERMFQLNRALVESICSAIPEHEAVRLRAQFERRVFGPFAKDAWDVRALLVSDSTGALRACEATQSLVREYEQDLLLRLRELQREFVRCNVLAASATSVRGEDWMRARDRVVAIQRRSREAAMALLDHLRAQRVESDRIAWDAAVDRFQADAASNEARQLARCERVFVGER